MAINNIYQTASETLPSPFSVAEVERLDINMAGGMFVVLHSREKGMF